MTYSCRRLWEFFPDFFPVPGVFDAEQCARIVALSGKAPTSEVRQGNTPGSYRSTDVFWLASGDPEHRWIFDRLRAVTEEFNARTYQFEIDECGDLQLCRYGTEQHYDWHIDLSKGDYSRRKLSLSVMLTDPAEYEGGGIEFGNETYRQCVRAPLGDGIAFPSWMQHRVVPVTKGERWSVVAWWLGPPFR
jgi:PKHD-type hydroxylase